MRAAPVPRRRRPIAALLACAALAAGTAAAQPLSAPDAEAALDATALALKERRSPVDPALVRRAARPVPGPRAAPSAAAVAEDAWPMILRDGGIVIDAASTGDPQALLAELEAIGLTGGAIADNAVSGLLPLDAVDALESCGSLAMARPALATTRAGLARRARGGRPPRPDAGSVVSQGVAAMRADRLPRSVAGAGTSVGLLSDTFDCLGGGGGRAEDVASGDLPPDVVLLDDPILLGCVDEGRAMAQIVHDVAPATRLGFHTAFGGQADFAQGIGELARQLGADVIVDDVLYFIEPFFQDGPVARAAAAAHAQGVAYFSAAGNAARRSYTAPFRDSGQTGFFEGVSDGTTRRHDFDPGPGVDVFQRIVLPPLANAVLVLQWDEPFVSASTADPPVGAASDYDLLVYVNEDPTALDFSDVYAVSSAFNPGGDAVEAVRVQNFGRTPLELFLAVERFLLPGIDGPDVERLKTIAFGSPVEMEWDTASPTSFGHANGEGVVAVGAAAWYETPRFGVSPPRLERFSSAGGVPIVLAPSGERLPEPVVRQTPDLVAPDGVNTTFFFLSGDIPQDDDAFPNFFGTSAAAPHAAGVAALLQGDAGGGAAVVGPDGALEALRTCFVWRREPRRIPFTLAVPPQHVEALLAAGAMRGPCGSLSPDAIASALALTAVDMAEPGLDFDTGYGLVDARRAWRLLRRLRAPALRLR